MKNYIARFEKVSFEQFTADYRNLITNDIDEKELREVYDNIQLPKRATKGSAGYDFVSTVSVTLKPGESIRIPTGIRCYMEQGYVLHIYPRSSLGMKFQMTLTNTVGIIDSDYYNAKNEGHMIASIVNRGNKDFTLNAGERFTQGVFLPYFLAQEEDIETEREGGFGSSGK